MGESILPRETIIELSGLGCGSYLLGTPFVASQSPTDGKMRFEVSSGTYGNGDSSIRLCASEAYRPSEPADAAYSSSSYRPYW